MTNHLHVYGDLYDQWANNYPSNLLRFEIDNEILSEIYAQANIPWVVREPQDYQVWFPLEIVDWCDRLQIYPLIKVEQDSLQIIFNNPQDCTTFQMAWL